VFAEYICSCPFAVNALAMFAAARLSLLGQRFHQGKHLVTTQASVSAGTASKKETLNVDSGATSTEEALGGTVS
jgi:hypothetical protein